MHFDEIEHQHDPAKGIYTAVGIREHQPVALDAHLSRLQSDCRQAFGVDLPTQTRQQAIDAASTAPDNHFLRIDVMSKDDITVQALPLPKSPRTWELTPVLVPMWDGSHKWRDRPALENLPTTLYVTGSDLIVLEGAIANVFFVFGNHVVTPPLDGRILPGIGRAMLLKAAQQQDIKVEERTITLQESFGADAFFATNSLRGVMRISRCAGHEWSTDNELVDRLEQTF